MTSRRRAKPKAKALALVVIEQHGDQTRYLRYEGTKLTDKAVCAAPISAADVELLRTDPRAALGD